MVLIRVIWSFGLILLCLLGSSGAAQSGELADRVANFPQWQALTSVQPAVGDLIYPPWMAGSWLVKSTLVDLAAPLAPNITTPGFAGNRRQLNQAVSFAVRFIPGRSPIKGLKLIPQIDAKSQILVADRAFNSLNLARAYLGKETVLSIKVDPDSPNRQITFLSGERQLVSIITARATETSLDGDFTTTEVFQQLFKSSGMRPYLNSVESTTTYHQVATSNPVIEADQVTAIYLSPQDPDYFRANFRPVALYRYRLQFSPISPLTTPSE